MVRGLTIFVLGLAAGMALGVFLFAGDTPAPVRPQATAATAADRTGTPAAVRAPAVAAPAAVAEPVLLALAAEVAQEEAAAADTRTLQAGGGTSGGRGTIDGSVVDVGGRPMAGVRMRAWSEPHWQAQATYGGSDEDLQAELRRTVQQWSSSRGAAVEVVTGPDGTFRFTGLPADRYTVQGKLAGHAVLPRGGSAASIPIGATVNFRVEPVLEVQVAVVRQDGGGLDHVYLEVSRKVGDRASTTYEPWTPDDPLLRVRPGTYDVTARTTRDSRHGEWTSDTQPLRATAPGAPPAPLSFTLRPRVGIRGRAILPDDEPFERGLVHLLPLGSAAAPDLERLRTAQPVDWVMPGDLDYEFLDLAPGRYAVGLARGWNEPVIAHAVVEVVDAVDRQDLVVPALTRNGVLIVHCRNEDGAPLAGLRFTVEVAGDHGSSNDDLRAVPQDGDVWWVQTTADLHEALADPAATITLTGRAGDHGTGSLELAPGITEYTLVFQAPAWLDVLVTGYRGSGLEGALHVELNRDREPSQQTVYAHWGGKDGERVGSDGTVRLGPCAPGAAALILRASADDNLQEIHRIPVRLVSGENRATIPLPALYELTVRFPADAEGHVGLSAERRTFHASDEIAEGEAVFPLLVAGDYIVRHWGGLGQMQVRVPDVTTVTFQADPVNALRVTILDPSGYLARQGFQDGDLLIQMHGKEFADQRGMQRAFMIAMGAEQPVKVIVQRGGRTVELAVDMESMMEGGEAGGSLEPATR